MPGYQGKTTNLPADAVGVVSQSERETTWGPIPGEIVSYDAAKGTATVKPLYKPRVNGKSLDMPDLAEVPVDQPRTGNAALTMPIPAGTRVILTPQMRAWDEYEEGNDGNAFDARTFHISNMRATLLGGDPLADPLPNADADNTHLRFDPDGQYGLKGSPQGKMQLKGSEGEIFDIMASAIEQDADGFRLLSTEPALLHTAEYAAIADELDDLAEKVRGMTI